MASRQLQKSSEPLARRHVLGAPADEALEGVRVPVDEPRQQRAPWQPDDARSAGTGPSGRMRPSAPTCRARARVEPALPIEEVRLIDGDVRSRAAAYATAPGLAAAPRASVYRSTARTVGCHPRVDGVVIRPGAPQPPAHRGQRGRHRPHVEDAVEAVARPSRPRGARRARSPLSLPLASFTPHSSRSPLGPAAQIHAVPLL